MTARRELQKSILSLVATLPPVQVQNRLMSCTDRDVALALSGLEPDEVDAVISHISRAKASRIEEEIRLQRHRRIEERHLLTAAKLILASLTAERSLAGSRAYFRPRQRPGNSRG